MSSCNCPVTQPGPTLASTCGGAQYMLFMGLLEVFLRSQCDLEDPCNRPHTPPIQSEYDFIIIGGGSGGSVVASRLSEIPEWNVLLIEAGQDEPTGTQVPSMFLNFLGSSIDWGFQTEPEPEACLGEKDKRCYWPRGKVLGGTSVMNGMMYMRGARKDFDDWAAEGNDGWSYNEVLPYFLKSEDNQQLNKMDSGFHTSGGLLTVSQFPYHPPLSQAILKGAQELGYPVRDLNGAYHTGFMIAQTTNKNGSRLSSAKAFLRPFKNRRNLHILLNSTVTRILINTTTKQAYGVEVLINNQIKQVIYGSKEIILSGGAVNSPQILLLSGIGPREHLQQVNVPVVHDLPGVGQNLHNHVAFFMNFYINDTNSAPLNWATAMEYLLFRDGLMSGTGISEVTGFINTKYNDPTLEYPDIQYFFGGFLANCAKTGQVGEKVDNNTRSIQIIPAVLHPKSRGYLKLRDNNPLSHPMIYANYYTHPDDVKVMVEGIKFAIDLSKTKALQRYGFQLDRTHVKGCENYQFGSDLYWMCAAKQQTGPENHQAGSCKMGPINDPLAVVNSNLQVYGVDRLRVIDASIMPKVTTGNTNAPTIMIGEKGADLIKSKWLTPQAGFFFTNNPQQRIDRQWRSWVATNTNLAITPNSKRNLELDLDFLEKRQTTNNRIGNTGGNYNSNNVNYQQQDGGKSPLEEISPESFDRVKVILLGAPAVGKTSIIQQFVWNDFYEEYIQTDRKHTYYPSVITNERLYEIKITDIPVIPYFPVNSYYEWANYRYYGLRNATAYILVFDLSNIETFQYIRTLRDQICESRNMTNVPILVVGNKQDLILDDGHNICGNSGDKTKLIQTTTHLTNTSGGIGGGGGFGGFQTTTTTTVTTTTTTMTTTTITTTLGDNTTIGSGSIGGGGGGGGILVGSCVGTTLFDEKRRDIINLVKKHWKCGYIECSAKYNWKVISVFKELINMIDNLETREQSPMLDNIQDALDRNKCIVI